MLSMLHDGDARSTTRTQFKCEFARSPVYLRMMHEVQSEGLRGRGCVSASGA